MQPFLKPEDEVIVFAWSYIFKKPKIGDLVVVRFLGKDLVKRIKFIEGKRFFLIGDNEKQSTDSRSFGWILDKNITGKVVLINRKS